MQGPRKQRVCLAGAADVNDAAVLELVGEYVDDQFENVVVKRAKGAVNEHPRRCLDQHPRKHQAQLLVLAELPIPAPGLVEQRRETFKTEPEQRAGKSARAETVGLERIGEDLAQTPARQIRRAARQVKYLFASRTS